MEVSLGRIETQQGRLVASALRDITERKKAEGLLADYTERLQELSLHLQTVREQERTHVARELHDELGQLLTALKNNPIGQKLSWLFVALAFVAIALLRIPLVWVLLSLGGLSCTLAYRALRQVRAPATGTRAKP